MHASSAIMSNSKLYCFKCSLLSVNKLRSLNIYFRFAFRNVQESIKFMQGNTEMKHSEYNILSI